MTDLRPALRLGPLLDASASAIATELDEPVPATGEIWRWQPFTSQLQPITCVVADDHPLVLDAVCRILETGGVEIVGCASDGEEAIVAIEMSRPRVAVVDLLMPAVDGVEVTRRAKESHLRTSVLICSGYGDREVLRRALNAGARGFLCKQAALPEYLRAVRLVASGRLYIDPVVAVR